MTEYVKREGGCICGQDEEVGGCGLEILPLFCRDLVHRPAQLFTPPAPPFDWHPKCNFLSTAKQGVEA